MKRDSLVQTQRHWRSRARLACTVLSALPASLGCRGGDAHELGYTTEPRQVEEAPDQPSAPFYADRDAFIGRWLGQAREPLAFGVEDDEASPTYAFPSGSSQIVLDIAPRVRSTDPVGLGGSIIFGSGQPPPAATDPDRGYPPGFDYDRYRSYDDSGAAGDNYDDGFPPLEGFRYVIDSSGLAGGLPERVPDGVLRMMYNPYAHLQSWCALQEPQPLLNGTFGVLPDAPGGFDVMADGSDRQCPAYGPADLSACPQNLQALSPAEYRATYEQCVQQGPELYRMSCDKMFLSEFCGCTAARCAASNRAPVSLLLRASDDVLIGVLEGAMFLNARGLATPIGEVRFRRLPD
jgi:hypothetical protein